MPQTKVKKTIVTITICALGALLNIAISMLIIRTAIPLYLDTVLTVSVTLLRGPFWGSLTGALTNIAGHTTLFWGWEGYLFALCNIATALVTHFFMRIFPHELNIEARPVLPAITGSRRFNMMMGRTVVLILLSFGLCLAMSILGGIISAFIQFINPAMASHPGLNPASSELSFSIFPRNFSIVLEEIVRRIPINIIDRLITAFGSYGIARLFMIIQAARRN